MYVCMHMDMSMCLFAQKREIGNTKRKTEENRVRAKQTSTLSSRISNHIEHRNNRGTQACKIGKTKRSINPSEDRFPRWEWFKPISESWGSIIANENLTLSSASIRPRRSPVAYVFFFLGRRGGVRHWAWSLQGPQLHPLNPP